MRSLARLSTETERARSGSGLASVNWTTRNDSSFPGERFFVCVYIYIYKLHVRAQAHTKHDHFPLLRVVRERKEAGEVSEAEA